MTWDPALYLRFADQRLRPALDLLARVDLGAPERVIDLGCGAGNVTAFLKRRWPDAGVVGIDNSQEMLAQARASAPGIRWETGDLSTWQPADPVTLLYSNAALHWADRHEHLFPRLARFVAPGGVLAIQMPHQYNAPSHHSGLELARSVRWRDKLQGIARASPVADPQQYYDWLAPHVAQLDIWETEYLQCMEGENPVADFTKATFLRQFLDLLDGAERSAFEAEYRELVLRAYPKRDDGRTLFPFRRLFIVARI